MDFTKATTEEIEDKLDSIELTEVEISKVKKDMYMTSGFKNHKKSKLEAYIEIYKFRFKLSCPTPDMAKYFNISRQQMRNKLDQAEWGYTKSEAGVMASKKRDYKAIRLKSRQTFLDDNKVYFGSSVEEYIRQKFNTLLPMEIPEAEIIVGLNNLSILNSGKEIDIPIIIMIGGNIIKYCIEPGNPFYHKMDESQIKRDERKKVETAQKGYKYIELILHKCSYKYVDEQINKIIDLIKRETFNSKNPAFSMDDCELEMVSGVSESIRMHPEQKHVA